MHRLATPVRIFSAFIASLVARRHLIWNFVLRDLKVRFVGSLMGFFWALVHPIVLLLSYTFVFSYVFQARVVGAVESYPIFLFCGILPWLYFQDTLLRSCESVVGNANLIGKSVFPSEILPLSISISNLVIHSIGLVILMGILMVRGESSRMAFLVPLALLLLFVLSLGLGWMLAVLQVFVRDTSQILSVALILWFWITPIFYQPQQVPAWCQPIIRANPLTYVVTVYRDLLLESRWPASEVWLPLLAWVAASFILGGIIFRLNKRDFADVI